MEVRIPPGVPTASRFLVPGVLGRQGVQSPSSRVRFLVPVPIVSSVVQRQRQRAQTPSSESSNLSRATKSRSHLSVSGLTDKALGFEPRRCGFNSCLALHGPVAERSRRSIPNRDHARSSRARASSFPLCRREVGQLCQARRRRSVDRVREPSPSLWLRGESR